MPSRPAVAPGDRIRWLERSDDDFPFYRGAPVAIRPSGWLVLLAAVALAFAALQPLQRAFPTGPAGFLPAIVFVGLPLAALAWAAGRGWTAIFRRPRARDLLLIVAAFLLTYAVTIAVGLVALSLFEAEPNPAADLLSSFDATQRTFFFLRSALQLFGEELFTILPFLALLWGLTRAGLSRRPAIGLAALAVSVMFALAHLPTYQWNYGQALVGLVPIRLVLLAPYLMTKNILVSTGAHILTDFATFALPLLAGEPAT